MTNKDLEYYQLNPDELPTDPETLEGLLEEVMAADEQGEPEAAPGQEDSEEDWEGTTTPISSKDGKHTIPYAVLATERERRRAAEQVQQELQQRIHEIEARLSGGMWHGQEHAQEQVQDLSGLLSENSLEEIVEDFPGILPMLEYTRSLEQKLTQFEHRFQEVEAAEFERQETAQQELRDQVRREVDASPALRFWENQDRERWEAAMEADRQLRNLPVNQGLSLKDRFAKVVAVVEAIYGPTRLPAEYLSQQQPQYQSQYQPQAGQQTFSGASRQGVDRSGAFQPRTLGEMPGGMAPRADDLEALLEQSPARLGAVMNGMTLDQITNLLAKAG